MKAPVDADHTDVSDAVADAVTDAADAVAADADLRYGDADLIWRYFHNYTIGH